MKKGKFVLAIFIFAVVGLGCSLFQFQGDRSSTATAIASTFVAGQTESASPSQTVSQSTSLVGSYPVEKCMSQNVPAGVATPFAFEWKECVVSIEVQADGSMKVNFRWEVTRLDTGSLPDGECLTKGSDYQNPNMYMLDDLGNHYTSTDVGTDIGICLLMGDDETGSFTDYFQFPPAHPDAKFLVFHDDDQGMQTEPFDITWTP